MDDAPSIIFLREPIEPLNRPQILSKSRGLKLGVGLSQVVADKSCLARHAAREQAPAQGAVGKRGDFLSRQYGRTSYFDGAFEQVVRRLRRLHGRNLAKGFNMRGTEIADADHSNLAGAEVRHRRRGFLDRHVGIGPMDLIDVDDIGVQPLEGILDLLLNARPAALRNGWPFFQSRPTLVAIRTRLRSPPSASALPTISSERPKP